MTQAQWIALIAGILGGGAMGSLITAYFGYRRNRRHRILFRLSYEPFDGEFVQFVSEFKEPLIDEANQLSVAYLSLKNIGYYDLSEFPFGLTLDENRGYSGPVAIEAVVFKSRDRHHLVTWDNGSLPTTQLDLIQRPLNRDEEYTQIYLYISHPKYTSPPRIGISTGHSARLISLLPYGM